ncbi:MAG: NlpC/P60 family protein [Bacteroidota bacterium]|jgi:cell wall-associated NlpC family hydrolase|nr:NlpC/P60 family protein [Bacteroidota bacterium]
MLHPHRILLLLLPVVVMLAACSGTEETTSSRRPSKRTVAERDAGYRPALPADLSRGRRAVVGEAYEWIGTPYRYAGTTKRGVDCSGLVNAVYEKFKLDLPRRARELFRKGRAITREQLRPADLVFFANTAGPGITHVGIYVGEDRFVHSSTRAGVIVSSLDDSYYARHYAGARMIIK